MDRTMFPTGAIDWRSGWWETESVESLTEQDTADMTRKDYELIAAAMRRAALAANTPAVKIGNADASHMLAAALASDNPRFDRDRFLAACGVES